MFGSLPDLRRGFRVNCAKRGESLLTCCIPAVFGGVFGSPRQGSGNSGPAIAVQQMKPQQDCVLCRRPRALADGRVEVVEPTLAALLARAGGKALRDSRPVARAVVRYKGGQKRIVRCCPWTFRAGTHTRRLGRVSRGRLLCCGGRLSGKSDWREGRKSHLEEGSMEKEEK